MEISASNNSEVEPLTIRVTSGGKMKSWVEVALKSFKEKPEKPVLLHTMPNTTNRAHPNTDIKISEPSGQEVSGPHEEKDRKSCEKDSSDATSTRPPSATVIPRLVSVVEIIKREYIKELPKSLTKSGLYQYNQIGSLEENEDSHDTKGFPSEEERTNEILTALSGSNNLKIQKTPYMRVMLSVEQLKEMDSRWTYQEPLKHKLSRNARHRFKKRQRNDGDGNDVQEMEMDGGTT